MKVHTCINRQSVFFFFNKTITKKAMPSLKSSPKSTSHSPLLCKSTNPLCFSTMSPCICIVKCSSPDLPLHCQHHICSYYIHIQRNQSGYITGLLQGSNFGSPFVRRKQRLLLSLLPQQHHQQQNQERENPIRPNHQRRPRKPRPLKWAYSLKIWF